jgi:hypothetical protein
MTVNKSWRSSVDRVADRGTIDRDAHRTELTISVSVSDILVVVGLTICHDRVSGRGLDPTFAKLWGDDHEQNCQIQ